MQDITQDHALNKIRDLEKRGYSRSYKFENDQLIDTSSKQSYSSDQVTICDEYRFEGISNPSDMSILYALETQDGHKSNLLVPYGPAGNTELALFMKDVEHK